MNFNIDNRCPRVTDENWEECCQLGWRHHSNVNEVKTIEIRAEIQKLQALHGATSVTVGQPFCDEALKPRSDYDQIMIGIYICDVAEQVADLYAELFRWEG